MTWNSDYCLWRHISVNSLHMTLIFRMIIILSMTNIFVPKSTNKKFWPSCRFSIRTAHILLHSPLYRFYTHTISYISLFCHFRYDVVWKEKQSHESENNIAHEFSVSTVCLHHMRKSVYCSSKESLCTVKISSLSVQTIKMFKLQMNQCIATVAQTKENYIGY